MNQEKFKFRGIVLYDIQRNGFLNGVYSNNHPATEGRIFTETARLRPGIAEDAPVRIYDSFYFDIEGGHECVLTFTITDGVYVAEWRLDNGRTIFIGEGFLMNDRQIAISYWLAN